MTWNKASCAGSCLALLQRTLDRYPPVGAYKLDGEKGIAYIRWKPESNFDLISIKRIYQSVGFGFGIGDVMVKVRGVVIKKGKDFLLKSLGDNSTFRLLGPPHPGTTNFNSTGSWQSYPLTADQRSQLQLGYQDHLVVEVSGGIFYNQFDYPMIITQDIKFTNKLGTEK